MEQPRLRGNTFIALLLRAGVQELSEKPEWGENNNGITRPNMFADLLRMAQKVWRSIAMFTARSRTRPFWNASNASTAGFNTPQKQRRLVTA